MHARCTRSTIARFAIGAALLAALAFSAAGAARAAPTPYVYTDKAGDSASAPDIQQVTLTDNGDGTVAWEIDLAATIPDDGASAVLVMIDADRNAQTGDKMGNDYMVYGDAEGLMVMRWDATTSNWVLSDHQPSSADLEGGRLTFTVALADLGTTSFDFVVAGIHGDDIDIAPESGAFTYPQTAATPTVKGIVVSGSVLLPKAGKKFAVPAPQVHLSDDEIVPADTYTCTLTNHGKVMQQTAKCTWMLPKTTKGKTLMLKLAVTYQGQAGAITLPVTPK